MDAAFQVRREHPASARTASAPPTTRGGRVAIGGEPAGRVLCYTVEPATNAAGAAPQPDRSHIEWTDDNSSIYAHAVRNDLADLSLYDWWLSASGPVVVERRRDGDREGPAGLTRTSTSRRVLPDLAHGTPGEAISASRTCSPRAGGRWRSVFSDGTYEIGANGLVIESGRTLLKKPNAIVFDPERAPCGGTPSSR